LVRLTAKQMSNECRTYIFQFHIGAINSTTRSTTFCPA